MCRQHKKLSVSILFSVVTLLVAPAFAVAAAGKFIFVHGTVTLTDGTTEQAARRGLDINEGDTIVTGANGRAQIRMKDGAMLAIRPETELRVDEYAYRDEGRSESSVMSLLKGTFRSVTGAIGREDKDAYQVKTPVATIGIRGTDHEPMYVPPGTPGVQAGTYDKVNRGATFLQTDGGRLEIGPNQVGFAGSASQRPVRLASMPSVYATATDTEGQEDVGAEAGEDGEGGDQPAEEGEGGEAESDSGGTATDSAPTEGASVETSSVGTGASTSTMSSSDPVAEATTDTPLTTIEVTDGDSILDLTNGTLDRGDGTVIPIESITTVFPKVGRHGAATWIGYDGGGYWKTGSEHLGHEPEDVMVFDSAGNLVEVRYGDIHDHINTLTVNGPLTGERYSAPGFALTGLTYGWIEPGSVSVDYRDMTDETFDLVSYGNRFHWITGPMSYPEYLPMIFKGSITYSLDGGTAPSNHLGETGVLNSASLTANFIDMTADFDLSASVSGTTWQANGSGVDLDYDGFYADVNDGTLTVLRNGSDAYTWGHVNGGIVGEGLSGAYLSYGFGYDDGSIPASDFVSGVAALTSGVAQNAAIDHRIVLLATYDPRGSSNPDYTPMWVGGGYNNVDDIGLSGTDLSQFRSELIQWTSTDRDHRFATFSRNAALAESGTDPETGIIWGRWDNDSSNDLATYLDDTSANFAPKSLHYLAGPVADAPVGLPTTGTYTYTLVGHTSPTDNTGAVGVLDSASLKANFTDMTVDASVQATVSGLTLKAEGSGIPLEGSHFGAGYDELAPLDVACPSGCSPSDRLEGSLIGGFTGTAAQGAGFAYSMRKHLDDGTDGTIISGVAAFKR